MQSTIRHLLIFTLALPLAAQTAAGISKSITALPASPTKALKADWLVAKIVVPAGVYRGSHPQEIEMSNGLIRRAWRLGPNAATIALDNLTTGAAMLRGVKPEAMLELNGKKFSIGGLLGQPDYAYLRREWIERLTADPAAFRLVGFETGRTKARFEWKRVRYSADLPWPPPGVSLSLKFEPPGEELKGVMAIVHYELYDGIPLLAKWVEVRNGSAEPVTLNNFISEFLAAVEYESQVEGPACGGNPLIQVESDYSFVATHPASDICRIANWVPDKQYATQVNYRLNAPLLLETRPPIGPDIVIQPGGSFETFRIFELLHDSTERERRGLAVRRMYRTLAPWVTENPILMHVRRAEPEAVKLAIDQCAAVGFEMVIMTFGSGFNIEREDQIGRA